MFTRLNVRFAAGLAKTPVQSTSVRPADARTQPPRRSGSPAVRKPRLRRLTSAVQLLVTLLAVAVLSACTGSLTSVAGPGRCPGHTPSGDDLVITMTATSAEPRPRLDSTVVDELDRRSRSDHACVYVVSPDGSTALLSLTPMRGNQVEQGSAREALRKKQIQQVIDYVGEQRAVRPGLDVVAAIDRAQRAHPIPAHLVVISSAISTQAPVDIRAMTWAMNGPVLGEALHGEGWLKLEDWNVTFSGVGEAAGSQPEIIVPARDQLARAWLGICRGAGGKECRAVQGAGGGLPPLATAAVPVVPGPKPTSFVDKLLADMSFRFSLNSSAPSRTWDVTLKFLVRKVMDNDLVITITGQADASTGDPNHNQTLSDARAETVRKRLVQLGLPNDRIITVDGIGSVHNSAVEESKNPGLVSQHRSVEISFSRRPPAK